MPIYEYECVSCGYVTERWRSCLRDESSDLCENCGGEAKRIISSTTFRLEGGGWASDGYTKKPQTDQ